MNRIKWMLACVLMPCALLSQTRHSIDLRLTGFKDGDSLRLLDLVSGQIVDSGRLEKGRAVLHAAVGEPRVARIHTVDGKYLVLYLDQADLSVNGSYADFGYCQIRGSAINDAWTRSRDYQRSWSTQRDSLVREYMARGDGDTIAVRRIWKRVAQIDSAVLQYRQAFIRTQPSTYFSVNELFFIRYDLSADSLRIYYNRMPASLKKTRDGIAIEQMIHNGHPDTGTAFRNIKGVDLEGKPHQLSDFTGRYVLLEFWASWCGPCRNENPSVAKVYQKYHDKGFEIVGFSIDTDKDAWASAIRQDRLIWPNLSDLGGMYSVAAASYDVRGVPQNFLIDPKGIIIAKNLRGEALPEKLSSIYAK